MILFVGDKPSANMKTDAKPFEGAACEYRFKVWRRYLNVHKQYNIVNRVEKHFSIWVIWSIDDGDPIIALGNAASKALGSTPHFKLPHPSGRNRQINDKNFIKSRLDACKAWLRASARG